MRHDRKGITLLELLITTVIVAALATALVFLINPAETLRQTRDTRRLVEMSELAKAIDIVRAQEQSQALGDRLTIYTSLFDPSATTTEGTNCGEMGLPPLSTSTLWTYHCAHPSVLRSTDGTGWIPLDFQAAGERVVLSELPIDPINTSSSGLYYVYVRGTPSSAFESQKFLKRPAVSDGGVDPTRYEISTDSRNWASALGLILYLNFENVASGTISDISGNNNDAVVR